MKRFENEVTGTRAGLPVKMPVFDLDKDKDNFSIWKARWQTHVQGNKLNNIRDHKERKARTMMELMAALSDFTINWLLNMNMEEEESEDPDAVVKIIETHIEATTNPLIQQVELGQIVQHAHESAEQLRQRIMEKGNRCKFETIKNYQDHQQMLALLRAVQPKIRKKMLLMKVDMFEKAYEILRTEEQAGKDADRVAGRAEGEAHAVSSYRQSQRSERSQSVSRGRPPDRTARGDSRHRGRVSSEEPCFRCTSNEHPHFVGNILLNR